MAPPPENKDIKTVWCSTVQYKSKEKLDQIQITLYYIMKKYLILENKIQHESGFIWYNYIK